MYLRDFEEFRNKKTEEEYRKWFDDMAAEMICIGGVWHPCIKLSSKKYALCDGTIFPVTENNEVKPLVPGEYQAARRRNRVLTRYDGFSDEDKVSVDRYFALLDAKEKMEAGKDEGEEVYIPKQQIKDRDGDVKCSFCGKSQNQARRLIAGPSNAYICDDCVDICAEILEEEFLGVKEDDDIEWAKEWAKYDFTGKLYTEMEKTDDDFLLTRWDMLDYIEWETENTPDKARSLMEHIISYLAHGDDGGGR